MDNIFKVIESLTGDLPKVKEAIEELRQVDTLLTQISKTSQNLSLADLTRMGDASFHMAGEYGKSAADYLTGIQEASQAGYQDAQGIAELSLALQTASDMTSQLASQLIQATDEAYNMNGSVERLTAALDGMVSISSHNTLNMEELSQGVSSISTAASLGVSAAQAAAALGAMMDATRDSGSDTAQAFQSILLYTRQISDSSAGINADGLKEYEEACAALNVKLKETRDGVVSLRNPMDILGELSLAYNKLSDSDSRKTGLLSALGEESQSKHLDALLRQWDTYESMLYQYTTGAGAMTDKVSMTADSWEGSLNRLSNTWFSVINNIVDSDSLIFLVNNLNNVISAIDRLTGKVKSMTGDLGNVGALIGLLASMKNVGKPKMFGFISL